TSHAAVGHDLVIDVDGGGGRQCKADAFVATAAGDDGCVDADDFAGQINEWAARISWVNRGIRLQEALELLADSAAILGANDSRSNGGVQTERAADSENPITDLDAVGIAQFCSRQFFGSINLNDGEVGGFIDADDFRGVTRSVSGDLHLNFGGLLN